MIDNCGRNVSYFTVAELAALGIIADEETGGLNTLSSPHIRYEDDYVLVFEEAGAFWRILTEAGPEKDGTYRAVEVEPVQTIEYRDRMYNRGE